MVERQGQIIRWLTRMSLNVLLLNSFQWKYIIYMVECSIGNEFHNRIIIKVPFQWEYMDENTILTLLTCSVLCLNIERSPLQISCLIFLQK